MAFTVSLCMIVRNEEHNLRACLADVASLVDEVVVVDTGSTDQTIAVAKAHGARVFEFPWVDDFAAARNETLRHAKGDWIMWLDADDRVDAANQETLASLLDELRTRRAEHPEIHLMSVLLEGDARPHGQARLFSAGHGLHWEGLIHEHIVDSTGKTDSVRIMPTNVTIRHTGYSDRLLRARKNQRDLRLLEKSFLLKPNDPLSSYYLGEYYHRLQNAAAALRFLRRSIDLDREGKSLSTSLAYVFSADILISAGKIAEADAVCREGLGRYPQQRELRYLQALVLRASGRDRDAEAVIVNLLNTPVNPLTLVTTFVQPHQLQLLLADILTGQRRWEEAEPLYIKVSVTHPQLPEPWVGLGQVAVATRRRMLLVRALEGLQRYCERDLQLFALRAQLEIMDQHWSEARRILEELCALAPHWPAGPLLLSDVLFQSDAPLAETLAVHRRVVQMLPNQADVRQRLSILEARMGQSAAFAAPGKLCVSAGWNAPAAPARSVA